MTSDSKKTDEIPRVPATMTVTPPPPAPLSHQHNHQPTAQLTAITSINKPMRPTMRPPTVRHGRPMATPPHRGAPLRGMRPNSIRPPPPPRISGGLIRPGQPRVPTSSSTSSSSFSSSTNSTTIKPFYRGGNQQRPLMRPVRPPFRSQRMNGPVNGQQVGPRPNGPTPPPVPEGRTVIGTKTVGGQQHEITMKDTALRPGQQIRPNQPQTQPKPPTHRPNTSTPPANISVSTKMVGGKEVQLVTPNQPMNRRPAVNRTGHSSIRMINRPNNSTQSQQPVFTRPPSRPSPSQANSQSAPSKPSMPVKLRRQVITDKPLASQSSNQPSKSLIKLKTQLNGATATTEQNEPTKENVDESNRSLDGVSELQLAKTLLNTGATKPKLNKATEKLYEKSKVPKLNANNKIEKPSRGEKLFLEQEHWWCLLIYFAHLKNKYKIHIQVRISSQSWI